MDRVLDEFYSRDERCTVQLIETPFAYRIRYDDADQRDTLYYTLTAARRRFAQLKIGMQFG